MPMSTTRARHSDRSSCHLAAAFSASAAGVHTILHVPDLLAIAGAFLTNLRALAAGVLVMGRVDQHEVSRCAAHFSARHHQAEVPRLHVLAALFETVCHGSAEAYLIAAQTLLDAGPH